MERPSRSTVTQHPPRLAQRQRHTAAAITTPPEPWRYDATTMPRYAIRRRAKMPDAKEGASDAPPCRRKQT